MTIKIEISGETPAEFHAKVLALLDVGGAVGLAINARGGMKTPFPTGQAVSQDIGPEISAPTPVAEPVPAAEVVEMPKRRGRPAKAPEPAPVVEDAQPEPPQAEERVAEEKTAFTPDDIKAVIGQIRDTKGLEIARQLLADFGGKKMSDISPDDYAAFMVKAQTYLEG